MRVLIFGAVHRWWRLQQVVQWIKRTQCTAGGGCNRWFSGSNAHSAPLVAVATGGSVDQTHAVQSWCPNLSRVAAVVTVFESIYTPRLYGIAVFNKSYYLILMLIHKTIIIIFLLSLHCIHYSSV